MDLLQMLDQIALSLVLLSFGTANFAGKMGLFLQKLRIAQVHSSDFVVDCGPTFFTG